MLGSAYRGLLVVSLAVAFVLIIVSLVLSYYIPAAPSTVTLATAFKGSNFEFDGRRYQKIFARSHVNLELRETAGAVENLQLLQDANSGVQVAFVTGGVSDGVHTPGVLSLGLIYNNPFWIFYSSTEPYDRLSQLKGKRIAVGPEGSGTRFAAEKVLGKANVDNNSATLLPIAGQAAADALKNGSIDAVWFNGGPDAPVAKSLLQDTRIRLLNFPMAEAFTRIFPDVVRLSLPQGAVSIEPPIPLTDVTLIGTTNKVLIRSDLHPEIVYLLLQAMTEVHGGLGIFQKVGEFPNAGDTEYPVAATAIDFYKYGPSLLQRHLPSWLIVHVQRAIAVVVTFIAIGVPMLHYLPILYKWNMRRRLLIWYRQLKTLEASIDNNPSDKNLVEKRAEVEQIERAVSRTRFPLSFTDQLYDLRGHIDLVRRRLALSQTPENA